MPIISYQRIVKRQLDIVLSMAGLIVLSPAMLIIAIMIKCESDGPVFFRQERIGYRFRPFMIYKFRTMRLNIDSTSHQITVGKDPRITRIGWYLRLTKLDETPQLLNILKGEMSIVGPRPEVRKYVELYRNDYSEILEVRPGLTDLASVTFRHESEILAASKDPVNVYKMEVLPKKIKLSKIYIRKMSFLYDMKVIRMTLGKLFARTPQNYSNI